MPADRRELCSLGASHKDLAYATLLFQVKNSQRNHPGAFVGTACLAVYEAGGVFAGPDHKDIGCMHRSFDATAIPLLEA